MDIESITNKKIIELLSSKSNLKSGVFDRVQEVFNDLKELLGQISNDFDEALDEVRDSGKALSKRVKLVYRDRGRQEAELRFADDVLFFSMLLDIHKFDREHPIYKNPYTQENSFNSYVGIINIHNFLYESVKYDRADDLGYLIARIFINHEGAFFVEGKHQSYNKIEDFGKEKIDREKLREIVENAMLYALSFDLLVPKYEDVKLISIDDMNQKIDHSRMRTGKRLGFDFKTDDILE